MAEWHVYIVRTRDRSLYAGVTTDVVRRVAEHEDGARGARYLRGKAPLELVYAVRIGERGLALQVENRLKKLSKKDKEGLVVDGPDRDALLQRLGVTVEPSA